MQYREFGKTGCKVSALGFGAMRLPVIEETGKVDEETAIKMIRDAIDAGVNYVDTAYVYHDGESEVIVGKALKDGYREKTYVATKNPVYFAEAKGDFEKYLDEQLKRLDMEYIDFYLLHALERATWEGNVLKYDMLESLKKAKEAGKIKHIGFSFHDDLDTFKEIVDAFDWEFCQIQYNYINTDYQAGREGLEYAASKGLGVVIMEPMLGGRLAVPPVQVAKALPDTKTPVEWALDFLWDQPEVGVVLSGMSLPNQVADNLVYAARSYKGMVTDEEKEIYLNAKKIFDTMALVPCTKCRYCMPCPMGIDIPAVYEAYNKTASEGMDRAKECYEKIETNASACVQCGGCESQCPQHIMSTELMPQIDEVFSK
ncbi:MAG: aldo/keto reductase [Lachnospiraceae bacterium]|nr:aldo/keto reductase [Lachnospiraceae bacterium]